ncbi:MAG: Hpt domain-containing protein, partial [Aquabacterium sp.]
MDASADGSGGRDLSTLAWVHDELRRSLENAHKALRRYLKEAEGASEIDGVDPSLLRQARSLIHQGVGALELVGLGDAATLLRASEAAVIRLQSRPKLLDMTAVEAIERGSFGLLDLLGRRLAGKEVPALLLFPQYRTLQQLAGAARIHPADLWPQGWQWQPLHAQPGDEPLDPAMPVVARAEREMLALMRGVDTGAARRMEALFAGLGAQAHAADATGRMAQLWRLAAAFFEGQADGLVPPDVYAKRIASRLLSLLRAGDRAEAPDRLGLDLLFFCAQAAPTPDKATGPRLAAVRSAYGLSDAVVPADYETARLGRFDPAWTAQARKRVAGAKEVWSAVAGGELMRIPGLAEQFALVGDSVQRLYPQGDVLARALQAASTQTVATGAEPAAGLAMEVATSLLYLDASLEDGDFDHPDMARRVQRLAERIDAARGGAEAGALDLWMEELYRRVSDRQTMGSVVQELRASLSEVEKQIDQYFRDPTQRALLIPVPAQLSAMRGVLSVLGMDQASQAVLRMRDDVDTLANTEVDPARAAQAGSFDRLADNLGALSFLIDMVSVQPQMAKSLFHFDADTGALRAVMGRAGRPSGFGALDVAVEPSQQLAHSIAAAAAQPDADAARLSRDLDTLALQATAADRPALADAATAARLGLDLAEGHDELRTAREQVAGALAEHLELQPPTEASPAAAPPLLRAADPAVPPSVATSAGTGLEDDEEMRGIFLEEAREVIAGAREALATLAHDHANLGEMTVVRRAFHTLKGSSRMVGLQDFGEAAWACEQLFNARLAESAGADADLQHFTARALDVLHQWADAIEQGQAGHFDSRGIVAAATVLRVENRLIPIAPAAPEPDPDKIGPSPELPVSEPEALAFEVALPDMVEAPLLLDLPEVADLDAPAVDTQALKSMVPGLPDAQDLDFTLDFGTADVSAPVTADPLALPLPPDSGVASATEAVSVAADELSFDLDLGVLEEVPVPASSPTPTLASTVADDLPLIPQVSELDQPPMPESSDAPAVEDAGMLGTAETADARDLPIVDVSMVDDATAAAAFDWLSAPADPPPLAAPLEPSVDLESVATRPAVEAPAPQTLVEDAEQYKLIGSLRIGIALFNIYLNEADELSRRLVAELGEWSHLLDRPVSDAAIALAHSLAGSSATVGYADLSQLARALEHALMRAQNRGASDGVEAALFNEAAAQIRHLLHQFAAGFLKEAPQDLIQRLMEHHLSMPLSVAPEADGATGDKHLNESVDADQDTRSGGLDDDSDPYETRPADLDALREGASWESDPIVAAADPLGPHLSDLVDDAGAVAPLQSKAPQDLSSPTVGLEDGSDAAAWANAVEQEPIATEPALEVLAPLAPDPVVEETPIAAAPVVAEALVAAAPVVAAAAVGLASVVQAMPTALADLGQPELRSFDEPVVRPAASSQADARDDDDDIDATDILDLELFPIFEEEALELVPQLQARMRDWSSRPGDAAAASACMRTLHTLKGGARLAGAMRLGEMAHRLETAIEHLLALPEVPATGVDRLVLRVDAIEAQFEALRRGPVAPAAAALAPAPAPVMAAPAEASMDVPLDLDLPDPSPAADPAMPVGRTDDAVPVSHDRPVAALAAAAAPRPVVQIDWSRFSQVGTAQAAAEVVPLPGAASSGMVRVRAGLLDRVVNHAGEVSITRSRIESDVGQLKSSVSDLSDNLDRLRSQLRDIELQAETQIASRLEAAKQAAQFDPLEMDRFTRFQELTRMMAEAVNDVATVQRGLQRTLQSTEDELAAQARLTRDLQDDLLRTRMVEFEGLSERLYRVVRQAAKESAKQVRLDIVGGAIEVDRGVLERMTGAFEHLLRNSVVHGVELPAVRQGVGKDATGTITVSVNQEGNEVGVEFRDDGAGLDLRRIEQRGRELGLLPMDGAPTEAELAALIFQSGFSTAEVVTGLAGRGVGMDVVRSEVNAMGGRIETATAAGRGTSFRLVLPLTTAVTQVVMLRCGELTVAVPSTLVEIVRRVPAADVADAYASGTYRYQDRVMPFFWLASLLQGTAMGHVQGRTGAVVVIRSAAQRVAVHVDEVVGNQEVVVKNLGPQLVRQPGLAGMTLLPSGLAALIYNPVALATVYGEGARRSALAAMGNRGDEGSGASAALPQAPEQPPLILVVDDSLTVRRVTQRLLVREGYRVVTAKDGMEGLEKLGEERPAVLLSDIEMPRMD